MRQVAMVVALCCLGASACDDEQEPPAVEPDASVDASTVDASVEAPADAGTDASPVDSGLMPDSRELTDVDRLLLHWLTPGEATESRVVEASSGELASTLVGLGAEGFVVTGALFDDPGYTLLAVRNVGSALRFETQVEQVRASELGEVHAALGADGYVVTAAATDDVGVTLVASRPTGTEIRYDTLVVEHSDDTELEVVAQTLANGRYAILDAFVLDAKPTFLAVRIPGTPSTLYSAVVARAGVDAQFWFARHASAGYAMNTAFCDAGRCMQFGTNDIRTGAVFGGAYSQMERTEIASEAARYSVAGFIPITLVRAGDLVMMPALGTNLDDLAPRTMEAALTLDGEPTEVLRVSCTTSGITGGFLLDMDLALGGYLRVWMDDPPNEPGRVYVTGDLLAGISEVAWYGLSDDGYYYVIEDDDGTVRYTEERGRYVFELNDVTLAWDPMRVEFEGRVACPY